MCATARPQLAEADTAFQAHPLVNRLNPASKIAQLDQRTALPDQCLHSAKADVQPPRRKSGLVMAQPRIAGCRARHLAPPIPSDSHAATWYAPTLAWRL